MVAGAATGDDGSGSCGPTRRGRRRGRPERTHRRRLRAGVAHRDRTDGADSHRDAGDRRHRAVADRSSFDATGHGSPAHRRAEPCGALGSSGRRIARRRRHGDGGCRRRSFAVVGADHHSPVHDHRRDDGCASGDPPSATCSGLRRAPSREGRPRCPERTRSTATRRDSSRATSRRGSTRSTPSSQQRTAPKTRWPRRTRSRVLDADRGRRGLPPRRHVRRVGSTRPGAGRPRRGPGAPRRRRTGVDQPDSIRPRGDVEAAGLTEVEEHGPSVVQQGEHARGTVRGVQVEVGHAPPEQRVSLSEVVVDVETGDHRGDALAWLVHAQQLEHGVAEGPGCARRCG